LFLSVVGAPEFVVDELEALPQALKAAMPTNDRIS
jgi:hypothetical protein